MTRRGMFSLRVLAGSLIAITLLVGGCTRTIQERKATETDPGTVTQVKFTGNKLKFLHLF